MSRKRASLLTMNSLTALSKVSSSTKTSFLVRNLSTASQRLESPFRYDVNGSVQSSAGAYSERNWSESQYDPVNKNSNFGGDYANTDQQFGYQRVNGSLQSSAGLYGERNWSGSQNDPVKKNSNFGGDYANTDQQFGYQRVNGSLQSSAGLYGERNWSESQNDPVNKNRNFGGDYANTDQQFGYQHGEVHSQNSWGAQSSSNRVGGGIGNGDHRHKQYATQYQQPCQKKSDDGQNRLNSDHDWNEVEGSRVSKWPTSTLEKLDGFCKEGKVKEAVEALKLLEQASVPVDLPRLVQLMRVCGDYGALEEAKDVHEHILRSHSPLKISTYNKILEMYWKCGSVSDAFDVFNGMEICNLTSWDTMIKWLVNSGFGKEAINVFTELKKAGLRPDAQMFTSVISACSVVGDINEGMLHFESMKKDYGIVPSMEHYVSIVDMMGSNGYVDEALEFIQKMPMEPSLLVWETLMDLCRVQGHIELGDQCAELIQQLDPSYLSEQAKEGLLHVEAVDPSKERGRKSTSQNILLSNVKDFFTLPIKKNVKEFKGGNRSPPELDILLRSLKEQMKEAGYVAETRPVLIDIDQESKEEEIIAHTERRASVQAFLTSPARSTVRVIKTLRICVDCHNALKIMSKIVGRALVIQGEGRYHHIMNGVCSCRDYW